MIKILLTLMLLILSPATHAEERKELIPARIINVSLVHYDYMEEKQFGLLMKVPNAVSGCFEVSGLDYETSFIDNNYMDIKVNGFRRTPVKTKNVAFDCNQRTKVISAMVPMNAEDLRTRNIRQIRFNNGQIEDNYNVLINDKSIALKPAGKIAFKPMGTQNGALFHNFGGAGIIALHVPMANDGEDIAQTIRNFAYKNGLTPAEKKSAESNVFYFMDENGTTLSKLEDGNHIELGTISIPRPYNSGQGLQRVPVPVKVFATRPGTTL